MKNIETLLQRYKEGTITPEEEAELNQLTHRDAVLKAAGAKAQALRRRRNVSVATVASVLLIVGVGIRVFTTGGNQSQPEPMIAKAEVPTVTELSTAPEPQQAVSEAQVAVKRAAANPVVIEERIAPAVEEQTVAEPKAERMAVERRVANAVEETVPIVVTESEPIVACNTQCSPDSVISGIWNFLKA